MPFLVPPVAHSPDTSSGEGEPATAPDPSPTAPDAITPELALVSPDLAATARRQLPDRSSAIETEVMPPRESAPDEPVPEGGRVQRRHLLVGLPVAVMILAGLIGAYEENTRNATRAPAGAPSGEALAKPPLLVPSSGYVVSPSGSFLTSPSGRAIERFTLPLRCGPNELQITNVALSARTFAYRGKAVGRATTIRLSARLVDRRRVRGVVSARGPRCSAGSVEFVARLS